MALAEVGIAGRVLSTEQAALVPDVTRDPSLGQAHLVFQVQNGTHRIISPQPYAESSFRAPSRPAEVGYGSSDRS